MRPVLQDVAVLHHGENVGRGHGVARREVGRVGRERRPARREKIGGQRHGGGAQSVLYVFSKRGVIRKDTIAYLVVLDHGYNRYTVMYCIRSGCQDTGYTMTYST